MRLLLKGRGRRLIAIVVLACVLGMGMTMFASARQVAHAGSNGQVIGFSCGYQLWDVYVYGYNQDGNYAAWHGNANGGYGIATGGWYWKGNVHIDFWNNYKG